jgi:hypothetical protein
MWSRSIVISLALLDNFVGSTICSMILYGVIWDNEIVLSTMKEESRGFTRFASV